MILEIKNLSVSFLNPSEVSGPLVRAVREASIHLEEGSFTSLVGESGSGKSVTALSICRLTSPHEISGEIYFYSRKGPQNLLGLSAPGLLDVRGCQIAYVFQDPASSLNPVMRVGEQIKEAYETHFKITGAAARKKTLEVLEAVRIKDAGRVYHSFPHQLSGGMKQRAMIAMALISEPRLLIADEPTTALDVSTEAEIMDLLLDLQRRRSVTVLFITHNLSLAASASQFIYVMEKGRVVEGMKKETDGFHPRELYTKKLFSAQLGEHIKPKSLIEI